jgi:hypothetical protein
MKLRLQASILFMMALPLSTVAGQPFVTENQQFKGWTKETKIVYADFKGKTTEQIRRLQKEAGLQATAQVGIRATLDVPKKKKDRGRLLEKVYAAPFFFKTTSITLTRDEGELDKQRIYFDMAEVYTRMARREFEHIADSAKTYGTIWIMYQDVMSYFCLEFKKMADAYTYEALVEKKAESFQKWRDLVNEGLRETAQYATTKIDCHRLLTDKPVDPAYEESKNAFPFKGCD